LLLNSILYSYSPKSSWIISNELELIPNLKRLTDMADLLSLFYSFYFSLLLISSKITIIIHLFLFPHSFLKRLADISIHALIRSERSTVAESAPQLNSKTSPASEEKACASPPGRGLRRIPP